jgi:aminopeptidase-like protein
LKVIEDLYLTNRVFCSSDYDRCIDYLCGILPFTRRRYTESSKAAEHGWEIHPKWDVEEAWIKKDGNVIWDGTQHPLAIIALAAPFRGPVELDELKEHLHTVGPDYKHPDAIPFHFRQQYRPWERDWGFCVPRSVYDSLEAGTYDVCIKTKESEGYLDVLEHTHQGQHDEMFVFVAHIDHPGMANDDLSGVAVGVELFERLRQQETKFSYRLLIVPEIIGSEYYLQELPDEERDHMLGAIFLEMLGSDTSLALQHSVAEGPLVDEALRTALEAKGIQPRTGPFRSIIGNDEIVWEAHGISMPSLSRFPYPEYHTSDDNLDVIDMERLTESRAVLEACIQRLEEQSIIRKNFRGVPATGHPKFDLYVDAWGTDDRELQALRNVMDYLPIAQRLIPVAELQRRFNVEEEPLRRYLERWEETGLIEIL